MSKILVVSAPYDDYHATWEIDKDLTHVKDLFGSNGWTNYIDDFDVLDIFNNSFIEKMATKIGHMPLCFDDVMKYFQLIVDDENVTTEMFSEDLINCVCRDRGSWSSYCWIETKGN